MANQEHLDILKQGVETWNHWRQEHADIKADLSGAELREADLTRADLLHRATLSGATLHRAILVGTNLTGATLTQCSIYGISVWNVQLEEAKQNSLVISPVDQPTITVDNLEVAQFIYLLLNHKKLRDVFNAVTEHGVLILGRFGGGGLEMLQAIAAPLALKVAKYYDKLDAEEDCHKTCIIVHSSIDNSLPPMRHHHLVSSKSNIRGGVQKGRTPMHARRTTFPTLPEEVNVC